MFYHPVVETKWAPAALALATLFLLGVTIVGVAKVAYREFGSTAAPVYSTGQTVRMKLDGRDVTIVDSICKKNGCMYWVRVSTPTSYDTLWVKEFEIGR